MMCRCRQAAGSAFNWGNNSRGANLDHKLRLQPRRRAARLRCRSAGGMRRPLVGVTADLRTHNDTLMHVVGDKYARAVWEAAGCTPIIIPVMAESQQVLDMLDPLDGLLFTGSPSNVHPARYGAAPHAKAEPYDEARDATTFPLIDAELEKGLPCLFIRSDEHKYEPQSLMRNSYAVFCL